MKEFETLICITVSGIMLIIYAITKDSVWVTLMTALLIMARISVIDRS